MWRNWRNRVRTDCVGRLAAWLKVAWITHDVIVIITMTLHHTYSSPTDSDCVNRICPFHWMNFLHFLLSLSSLSVVIRVRLSGTFLFSLSLSVSLFWIRLAAMTVVNWRENSELVWMTMSVRMQNWWTDDGHTSSAIRQSKYFHIVHYQLPTAAHFFVASCECRTHATWC